MASWLKGDFGYTLDKLFPDIAKGGQSVDPATVAGVKITQDQAGFFNLPVCQVKDLRSFPAAKPPGDYKYSESALPLQDMLCRSLYTLLCGASIRLDPQPSFSSLLLRKKASHC